MDLSEKSDGALLQSMLGEIAKALNEVKCAQGDITKATSRLSFLLVLANTLIQRNDLQKDDYK
jgi:hypothetical protein